MKWWCSCGGVFCCPCAHFFQVFVWWCGGVLVMVFLWWCFCGGSGVFVVV